MFAAQVPGHWLGYFNVDDVDASARAAVEPGGRELVAAIDFPGGRMAIVSDPEGASFGLLKLAPAERADLCRTGLGYVPTPGSPACHSAKCRAWRSVYAPST